MVKDKGTKSGFTIIETMLFLALTGLMMAGVMVGIGTNVARTRYNDSVEDIVSTLRDQYEQVNRTQIRVRNNNKVCQFVDGSDAVGEESGGGNRGRGRSDCSIYGVAIMLGVGQGDDKGRIFESVSVIGKDITAYEKEMEDVGGSLESKTELEMLKELKLTNIINYKNTPSSSPICKVVNVIEHKNYNWGAKVMHTKVAGGQDYVKEATILIIRSPKDGTVHTYVHDYSTKNYATLVDPYNLRPTKSCENFYPTAIRDSSFTRAIENAANGVTDSTKAFVKKDLYLCVASDDALATYGKRRMIKIAKDGHGSSAVSLIDMDDESAEGGNECK